MSETTDDLYPYLMVMDIVHAFGLCWQPVGHSYYDPCYWFCKAPRRPGCVQLTVLTTFFGHVIVNKNVVDRARINMTTRSRSWSELSELLADEYGQIRRTRLCYGLAYRWLLSFTDTSLANPRTAEQFLAVNTESNIMSLDVANIVASYLSF